MTANFMRAGGRLDLHDAVSTTRQVGLTAQGYIDFAHDASISTAPSCRPISSTIWSTGIPVVGVLLGGGQHEGMFGVNYRITGPASGPTLTVNPFSGVTPGIFRKIFGVVDGTTPTPVPGATPRRRPMRPGSEVANAQPN